MLVSNAVENNHLFEKQIRVEHGLGYPSLHDTVDGIRDEIVFA